MRADPFRAVLLASVAACMAATEVPALRGIAYDPPRRVADIRATDTNGQPYIFARQPHPLALVVFGYVNCMDVCATNLVVMKRVQGLLGKRADQVQLVFVTIDPEYETPARMKEVLAYHQGEIVGLTGTLEDLAPVYAAWNIVRTRKPVTENDPTGRGYKWDHTAQMFLVRDRRDLLTAYPYGTDEAAIAGDIGRLLDDPAVATKRLPAPGEVRTITFPPLAYSLDFAKNPTIPAYVRLRAGDTLRWVNNDFMDHAAGEIVLSPGESATQTYDTPGDYYFLCTATPGEALRISVLPRDGQALAGADAQR